jgi:hypothetical protein
VFDEFMVDKKTGEMGMRKTKVKGLGKLKYIDMLLPSPLFRKAIKENNFKFAIQRFAKLGESLRRGLIPNEIIDIVKEFSLEDDKRLWSRPFNSEELQDSEPLEIMDGKIVKETELFPISSNIYK